MCESSSLDMRKKCRVSCGACTRANNGIEHKVNSVIANLVDKQQQQFEAHTAPQTHPPVPDIPLPPAPSASVNGGDLLSQFLGPTAADPYVAQKKYAAGELPDPHSGMAPYSTMLNSILFLLCGTELYCSVPGCKVVS